jgi:hypothetical protein
VSKSKNLFKQLTLITMPLLTETIFQNAIARVGTEFTSFENKLSEYGALRAINDDKNKVLSVATLEAAKNSKTQLTKIPILKKYDATLITGDACTVDGEEAVSAFVNPTYSTYGFSIAMSPEVHSHNYIGYEETLAHELKMGWKKIFATLDSAAVAKLEATKDALTGKTSNYFSLLSGAMNYTGNPLEIYAKIPGFLKTLDMQGSYVEVANTEALTTSLLTQTYGGNNQQNLAALMTGNLPGSAGFNTYTSNRVVTGSNKEVRYIFEEGSHAILNWTPTKVRENYRITEADYWTQIQDPYFGFNWGVHYVKDCADLSATYPGLDTASIKEGWNIFADFGFIDAYSSDTTSPTVKFTVNDPA